MKTYTMKLSVFLVIYMNVFIFLFSLISCVEHIDTNGEQEASSEPELPTYSGGYNVNPCSPEVESEGYAVGQVAGDFELIDQYGENLRLSDFCGNTVLLVTSAFW